MYIKSYGAVQEVTGSMHLLTTDNDRILLDCGLFQGKRKESEAKNKSLPFDPKTITNIILSHAHIDHCGRIPLMIKNDFQGRILTTRPTADACEYLLLDSAHIQESDAQYLNYKTAKKYLIKKAQNSKKKSRNLNKIIRKIKKRLKKDNHKINHSAVNEVIKRYKLEKIVPLYTEQDANNAIELLEGYPYGEEITTGKNATVTFFEAGHILGSALSLIRVKKDNKTYRILFTGDLGRFGKPIIKNPHLDFSREDQNIDILILESTYGDREHEPIKDLKTKLKSILNETYNRGGSVIIPSFAFGRTQEIIYFLHELYNDNEVPLHPIYIDSPLANNLTRVFGEHPEVYNRKTHTTFLKKGQNPFIFDQIRFIQTSEESLAVCQDSNPKIVISASGMCEAGRILHHFRYNIHNPNNTILIVGYMAKHTLGRRILELGKSFKEKNMSTPPMVRILNKDYPLRAKVRELGGFSAHGDKNEMYRFLKESRLKIKKILLVHGEKEQIFPFKDFLTKKGFNTVIPNLGEQINI